MLPTPSNLPTMAFPASKPLAVRCISVRVTVSPGPIAGMVTSNDEGEIASEKVMSASACDNISLEDKFSKTISRLNSAPNTGVTV